jgi:hypothetical protein
VVVTTHCLQANTIQPQTRRDNLFTINHMRIGPGGATSFGVSTLREDAMETLMTAITVTAGMAFSLAVAILVEEWIFGKVFGLFFSQQAVQVESGQER